MPVSSAQVPLGTRLPWFRVARLEEPTQWLTPKALAPARPTVIAFLCNHSPYVRVIERHLAEYLNEVHADSVNVLAISSNDDRAYPSDSRGRLIEQIARAGFVFPYCLDRDQRAAKAFRARCTPEFFVYDNNGRLVYHGRFDGSVPGGDDEVSGVELRRAVEAARAGIPLWREQHPSFGCSIKWRAGTEPGYSLRAS
jgi:hypothetical protein